jgi:hypothetical protein
MKNLFLTLLCVGLLAGCNDEPIKYYHITFMDGREDNCKYMGTGYEGTPRGCLKIWECESGNEYNKVCEKVIIVPPITGEKK